MRTPSLLLAVAVAMLPMASTGAVSELSQTELRALVSNGQVISAHAVVQGVSTNFGGRVLEIRAFTTDNGVAYRVLLQQNSGEMGEVMVDGLTGHQIMQGTSLGSEISSTARTSTKTAAASTQSNRNSASQTGNDRSRTVRSNNGSNQSSNNGRSSNAGENGNSGNNGNAGGNGKGRNK